MEAGSTVPTAFPQGNITQSRLDSLKRAVSGQSLSNFPAIFQGFAAKGIPESEIKPRENVFTFEAWKALGSRRMGRHLAAGFVCFLNDYAHLLNCECRVTPVRVHFYEVRSMTNLLANSAPSLLDPTDHLRAGGKIEQVRRNAKRIVLTEGGYRSRRDLHCERFGRQFSWNEIYVKQIKCPGCGTMVGIPCTF